MNDKFTIEELNLIRMYVTCERTRIISNIKVCLPYTYDPTLKKSMLTSIEKLKNMKDDEIKDIVFPSSGVLSRWEV